MLDVVDSSFAALELLERVDVPEGPVGPGPSRDPVASATAVAPDVSTVAAGDVAATTSANAGVPAESDRQCVLFDERSARFGG